MSVTTRRELRTLAAADHARQLADMTARLDGQIAATRAAMDAYNAAHDIAIPPPPSEEAQRQWAAACAAEHAQADKTEREYARWQMWKRAAKWTVPAAIGCAVFVMFWVAMPN